MSNLVESMKACVDSILGIRTKVGADIQKVYIVARTWEGPAVGEGSMWESTEEVTPTPGVKDHSHSLRVTEGGSYKEGDLIIHQISKHRYPLESDVDCSSSHPLIEKIYKVGDYYYRVIHVRESHLTWDVHVRRLSDQTKSEF